MEEYGEEIKKQFGDLISEMRARDQSDMEDWKEWKRNRNDLERALKALSDEAFDIHQAIPERTQKIEEYRAISKACEPLLEWVNLLLEQKKN